MARREYLQRELEQAWRNARGADHAGRYDVADWWESRARDLEEMLKSEIQEGPGDAG